MEYLKKHKNTIIISLAVGILLIFLQKPLNYLGEKTVNLFVFTSDKFDTYFYTSVAENNSYIFSASTDFNTRLIFCMILIGGLFTLQMLKAKIKETLTDQLQKLKKIREELSGEEEEQPNKGELLKKELLLERVVALDEKIKSNKERLEKKDKIGILFMIVIAFVIVTVLSESIINTYVMRKNIEFAQKTAILLPYIGQESVNKLRSSWAQMTNKNDYTSIRKELEKYEKSINHGIK